MLSSSLQTSSSSHQVLAAVTSKISEAKARAVAVLRGEGTEGDKAALLLTGRCAPPLSTVDVMDHASPQHKAAAARWCERLPMRSVVVARMTFIISGRATR